MSNSLCICYYKFIVDDPVTLSSTVFGFALSAAIIVAGINVNHIFWKKLQKEKRETPHGRKGNVIEPVMSWFCILQMVYWPYYLLYLWINTNEIISSDEIPSSLCSILLTMLKVGRMYISYNSLFVAFIRYVYIVHRQASNEWNYKRAAKRLKVVSVALPMITETISAFTFQYQGNIWASMLYLDKPVQDCLEFPGKSNETFSTANMNPTTVNLAFEYLPSLIIQGMSYFYIMITVLVYLNIPETYLYAKIFRTMERYCGFDFIALKYTCITYTTFYRIYMISKYSKNTFFGLAPTKKASFSEFYLTNHMLEETSAE